MNWTLATPEITLALCGLGILLWGVLQRREAVLGCSMLTLGAFLVAALLVVQAPDGSAYNGLFVVDAFARFIKLLVLVGATLALLLSLDDNRRTGIARFEFPVLILFATLGMFIMASAANLMTLYLGVELQSLAIYVLAAFARDDVRSSEAGLKYFVLGALASGLLLYGISLVYGFSGSMGLGRIARAVASSAGASSAGGTPGVASLGLIAGLVFIIAGLAFKVSAVPFHMWTPDVYEGAPTSVTAFMGGAAKIAAMALILRVLTVAFAGLHVRWLPVIELVSIASMLLGALAAIGQTNIKRLLAYSSIGHMGYALIGVAAGTAMGLRGVLVYLLIYVFMNAGAFGCVVAMRRRGQACERIADLAGLGRTDPKLALALAVFMFGMAGIPPLAGFFAKFYVFLAAVDQGLWTLAVIGVLTSVVGAVYYLRIVKLMYFDAPEAAFDPRTPALSFVIGLSALVTTFFIVFPGPFVAAATDAARVLLG